MKIHDVSLLHSAKILPYSKLTIRAPKTYNIACKILLVSHISSSFQVPTFHLRRVVPSLKAILLSKNNSSEHQIRHRRHQICLAHVVVTVAVVALLHQRVQQQLRPEPLRHPHSNHPGVPARQRTLQLTLSKLAPLSRERVPACLGKWPLQQREFAPSFLSTKPSLYLLYYAALRFLPR